MAVRKSQQDCVNRYINNHYDRINLTVPKGKKEIIKAEADKYGESVNAYILRAIETLMGGGGLGISSSDHIHK